MRKKVPPIKFDGRYFTYHGNRYGPYFTTAAYETARKHVAATYAERERESRKGKKK